MQKIVIFRTNSRFNMVTPKQWNSSKNKLSIEVQDTARVRKIDEATFSQFKNLEHRKEVQQYLREVWCHG
jgi:hypothetical protein